jgi:glycosyltransferase involved in cell wall biosynthesis
VSPAVTVIVPTYNRPELLVEALRSAQAQTFDDFVVLVGDNAASEVNERAVRSVDDPRIQYLARPESLGAQGNWLDLIARATTPLVASLHDDDTWTPTFLEKTVPALLDDPTVSISFSDYLNVDEDGAPLPEYTDWLTHHSGRDTLPAGRFEGDYADCLRVMVLQSAPQPAYAAVLRRQAVMDTVFPPDIEPIYDLWLNYRMCSRGEGFSYVPERLTRYRVWGGSLTAAGFGPGQDAVFGRIIGENQGVGEVLEAFEAEWAAARFSRARDLLGDPAQLELSQRQFRLAAPHLHGAKWLAAEVAGRSTLGWKAIGLARRATADLRTRLHPDRLREGGVPDRAVVTHDRPARSTD